MTFFQGLIYASGHFLHYHSNETYGCMMLCKKEEDEQRKRKKKRKKMKMKKKKYLN
jgi:hypothetical protein